MMWGCDRHRNTEVCNAAIGLVTFYELTGDRAMITFSCVQPKQVSRVVVAKSRPRPQNQISANPAPCTIANRGSQDVYLFPLDRDGLGNISYSLGNITIAKRDTLPLTLSKGKCRAVLRLPVNAVESDEETKVADTAVTLSTPTTQDLTVLLRS